jgi:methylaspartate mutase epsilon subunit
VLDVAITPWTKVKGDVLALRDTSGILRYINPAQIPVPARVMEYHRQKIAEREKAEGRKANIEMAIRDFHVLSTR